MANKSTQFKKGESGNKNGRPKGTKNFTTIVREALQVLSGVSEGTGKDKRELTMEELLAKKIVADAIKTGDTALRRLIWNYLDGMPLQKTDLTSGGDKFEGIGTIIINTPNGKKNSGNKS